MNDFVRDTDTGRQAGRSARRRQRRNRRAGRASAGVSGHNNPSTPQGSTGRDTGYAAGQQAPAADLAPEVLAIVVSQRERNFSDQVIDFIDSLDSPWNYVFRRQPGAPAPAQALPAQADTLPPASGERFAPALLAVLGPSLEALIWNVAKRLFPVAMPASQALLELVRDSDRPFAHRLRDAAQALERALADTRLPAREAIVAWLRVIADTHEAMTGMAGAAGTAGTFALVLQALQATQRLLGHEVVSALLPAGQGAQIVQILDPLVVVLGRLGDMSTHPGTPWQARLGEVARVLGEQDALPHEVKATTGLVMRLSSLLASPVWSSPDADAAAQAQVGLAGIRAIVDYLSQVTEDVSGPLQGARDALDVLPGVLEALWVQNPVEDPLGSLIGVLEQWPHLGAIPGLRQWLPALDPADVQGVARVLRLIQGWRNEPASASASSSSSWIGLFSAIAQDPWVRQRMPATAVFIALGHHEAALSGALSALRSGADGGALTKGVLRLLRALAAVAAESTGSAASVGESPGWAQESVYLADLGTILGALLDTPSDTSDAPDPDHVSAGSSRPTSPLSTGAQVLARPLTPAAAPATGASPLALVRSLNQLAWFRENLPQTFVLLDLIETGATAAASLRQTPYTGARGNSLIAVQHIVDVLRRATTHAQSVVQDPRWESLKSATHALAGVDALLGRLHTGLGYLGQVNAIRHADGWSARTARAKALAADLLADPAFAMALNLPGAGSVRLWQQWIGRWLAWSVQVWAFPLDAPIHQQLSLAIRLAETVPLDVPPDVPWGERFASLDAGRDQILQGLRVLRDVSGLGQAVSTGPGGLMRHALARWGTPGGGRKALPWVAGYVGGPYLAAAVTALNTGWDIHQDVQQGLPADAGTLRSVAAYASRVPSGLAGQIPAFMLEPLQFLAAWTRSSLAASTGAHWSDTLMEAASGHGGMPGMAARLWVVVQVIRRLGTDDAGQVARALGALGTQTLGPRGGAVTQGLVTLVPAGLALYRVLPPQASTLGWGAWIVTVTDIVQSSDEPALKALRGHIADWSEQQVSEAVVAMFEAASQAIAPLARNPVHQLHTIAQGALSNVGAFGGPLATMLASGYIGYHGWRRGNPVIAGLAGLIAASSLASGAYAIATAGSAATQPAFPEWQKKKREWVKPLLAAYEQSNGPLPGWILSGRDNATYTVTGRRRGEQDPQTVGAFTAEDLVDRAGRFGAGYWDLQIENIPPALLEKLEVPLNTQYAWLTEMASRPHSADVAREELDEAMYRILVGRFYTSQRSVVKGKLGVNLLSQDEVRKVFGDVLAGRATLVTVRDSGQASPAHIRIRTGRRVAGGQEPVIPFDLDSGAGLPSGKNWTDDEAFEPVGDADPANSPLRRTARKLVTNLLASDRIRATRLIRTYLDAGAGSDENAGPVKVWATPGASSTAEQQMFTGEEVALGAHEVELARRGYQNIRIDDASDARVLPAPRLFDALFACLQGPSVVAYQQADTLTGIVASLVYRELLRIRNRVPDPAKETIGRILSGVESPRLVKTGAGWSTSRFAIEASDNTLYLIDPIHGGQHALSPGTDNEPVLPMAQTAGLTGEEAKRIGRLRVFARSWLLNALLPEATRRQWQAEIATQAWSQSVFVPAQTANGYRDLSISRDLLTQVNELRASAAFRTMYARCFYASGQQDTGAVLPDTMSVMKAVRDKERDIFPPKDRSAARLNSRYRTWCEALKAEISALTAQAAQGGTPSPVTGKSMGALTLELATVIQRWEEFEWLHAMLLGVAAEQAMLPEPARRDHTQARRAAVRQILRSMGLQTDLLDNGQLDAIASAKPASVAMGLNVRAMGSLAAGHYFLAWARRGTRSIRPGETDSTWIDRLLDQPFNWSARTKHGPFDLNALYRINNRVEQAQKADVPGGRLDEIRRATFLNTARLFWTPDEWFDLWLTSAFSHYGLNYDTFKDRKIEVSARWDRVFATTAGVFRGNFKGLVNYIVRPFKPELLWTRASYSIMDIAQGVDARDTQRDDGALASASIVRTWPDEIPAGLRDALVSGYMYADVRKEMEALWSRRSTVLEDFLRTLIQGKLASSGMTEGIARGAANGTANGATGSGSAAIRGEKITYRGKELAGMFSIGHGERRWIFSLSGAHASNVAASWGGEGVDRTAGLKWIGQDVRQGLTVSERSRFEAEPANWSGKAAAAFIRADLARQELEARETGAARPEPARLGLYFDKEVFKFTPVDDIVKFLADTLMVHLKDDLNTLTYTRSEQQIDMGLEAIDAADMLLSHGAGKLMRLIGRFLDLLEASVVVAQARGFDKSEESWTLFLEYAYGRAVGMGLGTFASVAAQQAFNAKARESFQAGNIPSDAQISQWANDGQASDASKVKPGDDSPVSHERQAQADGKSLLERLAGKCRVRRAPSIAGAGCSSREPFRLGDDEWRQVAAEQGWHDAEQLRSSLGDILAGRDYLDQAVLLYRANGVMRRVDPDPAKRYLYVDFKVDSDNLEWKQQLRGVLGAIEKADDLALREFISQPRTKCHDAAQRLRRIVGAGGYASEIVQLYFWKDLRNSQTDHVALLVRIEGEEIIIDPTLSQFDALADYAGAVYAGPRDSWENLLVEHNRNSVVRRHDPYNPTVLSETVTEGAGAVLNAPPWYDRSWYPVNVAQGVVDRLLLSSGKLPPTFRSALANIARTPETGLGQFRSLFLETYDRPDRLNALQMRNRTELEAQFGPVNAWQYRSILQGWGDEAIGEVARRDIPGQIEFLTDTRKKVKEAIDTLDTRWVKPRRTGDQLALWWLELGTKIEMLKGQRTPEQVVLPAGIAGRHKAMGTLGAALADDGADFQRILWERDWTSHITARTPEREKANAARSFYGKPVDQQRLLDPQRRLPPDAPGSIDIARNIFKLMAEGDGWFDPTKADLSVSDRTYRELVGGFDATRNYVVLVEDDRLGHAYVLDFPAGADAGPGAQARPCYVLQAIVRTGTAPSLLPQVSLQTWLAKKASKPVDPENLGTLYGEDFDVLDANRQRGILASIFIADDDAGKLDAAGFDAMRADIRSAMPTAGSWRFTVREYDTAHFWRNLSALRENALPAPVRSVTRVSLSQKRVNQFKVVRHSRDTASGEALGYIPVGFNRSAKLYTSDAKDGAPTLLIHSHAAAARADTALPGGINLTLLNADGELLCGNVTRRVLTQRPRALAEVFSDSQGQVQVRLPDDQTLMARDMSEDASVRLALWLERKRSWFGYTADTVRVSVEGLPVNWATTKVRRADRVAGKPQARQDAYHPVPEGDVTRVFVTGSADPRRIRDIFVVNIGDTWSDWRAGESRADMLDDLDTNRVLAGRGQHDRTDVLVVEPGRNNVYLGDLLRDLKDRGLVYRDVIFSGCRVRSRVPSFKPPRTTIKVFDADVVPMVITRRYSDDMSAVTRQSVDNLPPRRVRMQAELSSVAGSSDQVLLGSGHPNPSTFWGQPEIWRTRAQRDEFEKQASHVSLIHAIGLELQEYRLGMTDQNVIPSGWSPGMTETVVMKLYVDSGLSFSSPLPARQLGALYTKLLALREARLQGARDVLSSGSAGWHPSSLSVDTPDMPRTEAATLAMAVALSEGEGATLISRLHARADPVTASEWEARLAMLRFTFIDFDAIPLAIRQNLIPINSGVPLSVRAVTQHLEHWMAPACFIAVHGESTVLAGVRPESVMQSRTYYLYDPAIGLAVYYSVAAFETAWTRTVQPPGAAQHADSANVEVYLYLVDTERAGAIAMPGENWTLGDLGRRQAGSQPAPLINHQAPLPQVVPPHQRPAPVEVSLSRQRVDQYTALQDSVRIDLPHASLFTAPAGEQASTLVLSAHGEFVLPETVDVQAGMIYAYSTTHGASLNVSAYSAVIQGFRPFVEVTTQEYAVKEWPNIPPQVFREADASPAHVSLGFNDGRVLTEAEWQRVNGQAALLARQAEIEYMNLMASADPDALRTVHTGSAVAGQVADYGHTRHELGTDVTFDDAVRLNRLHRLVHGPVVPAMDVVVPRNTFDHGYPLPVQGVSLPEAVALYQRHIEVIFRGVPRTSDILTEIRQAGLRYDRVEILTCRTGMLDNLSLGEFEGRLSVTRTDNTKPVFMSPRPKRSAPATPRRVQYLARILIVAEYDSDGRFRKASEQTLDAWFWQVRDAAGPTPGSDES
ncbi:cycle-inhibiting factor [Paraburkholderia aspalathi]|uniref:cycle-inhibiting factor n=1 Tax=Paraburkholderia aspalathi TaxID=1324617 RepID=UPI0038BDA49D